MSFEDRQERLAVGFTRTTQEIARRRQERRDRERRDQQRRRRSRRRWAGVGLLALLGACAIALAAGPLSSGRTASVIRIVITRPLPSTVPVQAVVTIRTPGAATRRSSIASASAQPISTGSAHAAAQPIRTVGSAHAAGAGGGVLSSGAIASFGAFERGLAGPVGIALVPVNGAGEVGGGQTGAGATGGQTGARETVLGDDAPAHGWSTTKVPVLVALLKASGGTLTSTERQQAQLAITESDNQSILDLFADLERIEGGLGGASSYITQLFRASGDAQTVVATAPPPPGAVTTFGQTEWSPREAVLFYRALGGGCLLPSAQTSYVLGLMEHIISSESWGLGSAGFAAIAFKGGWGPEDGGYLVRQSGIIDPSSAKAVAVSIVAHPPPGADSFSIGTEMVTQTSVWLARHILLVPRTGAPC